MRKDLTDHDVFRDLTAAGVPGQVAIRAAFLLGGRQTLFVDSRRIPDAHTEGATFHEVVIVTNGRVIHVSATERDQVDDRGRKFHIHAASVIARHSLTTVAAHGDEAAWDALLTGEPIAATLDPLTNRSALRQYVLTFDGYTPPVTIPLSASKQDEADQVASCLAYDVKRAD